MNEFLKSGMFGNISLDEEKKQRKIITERWEKSGLIDGLKGLQKENIALRPDLSPDKIEELLEVPAYKRRNLKINNKA